MSKSKNEYSEKDIATNLLVTLKHMKYEYKRNWTYICRQI